jgi:hypothetical protein
MKSCGRAPTFLAATGYEQVRSIVAGLAGDLEEVARVELELPETGTFNAPPALKRETAAALSCCVANAEAKVVGEEGCGCAPENAIAEPAACRQLRAAAGGPVTQRDRMAGRVGPSAHLLTMQHKQRSGRPVRRQRRS